MLYWLYAYDVHIVYSVNAVNSYGNLFWMAAREAVVSLFWKKFLLIFCLNIGFSEFFLWLACISIDQRTKYRILQLPAVPLPTTLPPATSVLQANLRFLPPLAAREDLALALYRSDALPVTQPTMLKHWRSWRQSGKITHWPYPFLVRWTAEGRGRCRLYSCIVAFQCSP